MSEERLKKLGLMSELREDRRRLKHRCDGIIGSLGDATFVRDPENPFALDGQKIMDFARELAGVIREGNALDRRIAGLIADLGIDED